jgi:hypothetical protein
MIGCGALKWGYTCALTKHHAMKVYWRVEVYIHAFFDSALDGGEWSASFSGRFTPRKIAPVPIA